MDELVQQSIKEVALKQKSHVPWKLDEPWKQAYYTFPKEGGWKAHEPVPSAATSEPSSITKLALYSWNVDFMLPYADSRMSQALSHLESLISKDPENISQATVIYLQECVESDLRLIASNPWIRDTFVLSDIDTSNWQSGHYGTISLIDRRVPIVSAFRVHFSKTRMERDVLVTDVRLLDQTIRLCNSHLESLAFEPPFRIDQMKLIAEYMHDDSVNSAVAAGDFNAIQLFDKTLHSDNRLKDAYLELGGSEEDSAGHTWGQQAATAQRERFGTTRMDKVYFRGGVELQSFERFGADVCVEDQVEGEMIVKLGFEKPWITDHLGVKAVFGVRGIKERI